MLLGLLLLLGLLVLKDILLVHPLSSVVASSQDFSKGDKQRKVFGSCQTLTWKCPCVPSSTGGQHMLWIGRILVHYSCFRLHRGSVEANHFNFGTPNTRTHNATSQPQWYINITTNPSPSTIPIINASRLRRDRIIPSKLLIPGIVAAVALLVTHQALGRTKRRAHTQDTIHASIDSRNGIPLVAKFCACLIRLLE